MDYYLYITEASFSHHIKSSSTTLRPTESDVEHLSSTSYHFPIQITVSPNKFISFFVEIIQEDEFSNQPTGAEDIKKRCSMT